MVTIKDIAKETGLGRSTVASLLSGKAKQVRISDRAIETVQAAAKKLGYQRNEIARSIAIGKTYVIGFLLPQEMSSEHCFRILEEVMNQTAKHSYFVKIVKIDSNSTPESIAGICLGQRFDGVVCYGVTAKTCSGMNNTDFIEKLHSKITSIEEQLVVIGEHVVEALLKEINDSMHKSFYEETLGLFDVKLVIRNSTITRKTNLEIKQEIVR